ncbi:hypothetical protein KCP70_11345 [Salmonella enterica subsp. enterica]|nr:hypothetical protein KCP70_11345 [Salmonella enterica subsp. enterica]
MLERHPDAGNVVAGSAISGGGGDGRRRNSDDLPRSSHFYLTHQVYQWFKTRPYPDGAQRSDVPVKSELAITQSIVVLQGQPVPENISPPVLILTHNNAAHVALAVRYRLRDFRPVYLVSIHLRG